MNNWPYLIALDMGIVACLYWVCANWHCQKALKRSKKELSDIKYGVFELK